MELKIGQKGRAETRVIPQNTAKAIASGTLEVFSTPSMIALMEQAAVNALALLPGQSTVGVSLDVRHIAATPLNVQVTANAELVEIDRKRLVFVVEAYDEAGKIGEGRHERFIIDVESFLAKAQTRKER